MIRFIKHKNKHNANKRKWQIILIIIIGMENRINRKRNTKRKREPTKWLMFASGDVRIMRSPLI